MEQITPHKSFTNWKAKVTSYELREAMLGVINPGVYAGFDTLISYDSTSVVIGHSVSGIRKAGHSQTGGYDKSKPTGVFMTSFGTLIHMDSDLTITAGVPVTEGYYILLATYNRLTTGVEMNSPLSFKFELIKEENESERTIDSFRELQPNEVPICIIHKTIDGDMELLSHRMIPFNDVDNPEYHRNNNFYVGAMSQLDLMTSFGTYGPGRFKYLGRTLYSIAQYMTRELRDRDTNHGLWEAMLDKLNMPGTKVDAEGKTILMPHRFDDDSQPITNEAEVPEKYGYKDSEATPEEVAERNAKCRYVNDLFSIWANLLILDQETGELWDQLGYPEEQPEYEKPLEEVLLITKTVWENMENLQKNYTQFSEDIWQRLGLIKGEESSEETVKGILDRADSVWNNLVKLMEDLDTFKKHVDEDNFKEGGVMANIKHIWETLGYDAAIDNNYNPSYWMDKNASLWENLNNLYGYVENTVLRSNEFNIQEVVVGSNEDSPVLICNPNNKDPEYRKTYIWELTTQNDAIISREFYVKVGKPWSEPGTGEGVYYEPGKRVSLILWRPQNAQARLIIKGTKTQVPTYEGTEFTLNNGGMAILYKKSNKDTEWYCQILNPGTKGSGGTSGGGGGASAGGLMDGSESIKSLVNGIPFSGTGQLNGFFYKGLGKYLRADSGIGVTIIDLAKITSSLYNDNQLSNMAFGAKGTVPIALARPDVSNLGMYKIIKLSEAGYHEALMPTNNPDPSNGGYWELGEMELNKSLIGACLNFSLPQYVMEPDLYLEKKTLNSQTGLVTVSPSQSSYLKWPGDWVKLRAERSDDGTMYWRIIENFRNPDVFLNLALVKIGSNKNNSIYINKVFGPALKSAPDKMRLAKWSGSEAFNSYINIVGRNQVEFLAQIDTNGTSDPLVLSDKVPFIEPYQVAGMLPSPYHNDGDRINSHERFAGIHQTQTDPFNGETVNVSFWSVGASAPFILGKLTWNFPLGGNLLPMMNYVFHNLRFEGDE